MDPSARQSANLRSAFLPRQAKGIGREAGPWPGRGPKQGRARQGLGGGHESPTPHGPHTEREGGKRGGSGDAYRPPELGERFLCSPPLGRKYSRALQLAPKKPGRQRQTDGRTQTSRSWQASAPKQRAAGRASGEVSPRGPRRGRKASAQRPRSRPGGAFPGQEEPRRARVPAGPLPPPAVPNSRPGGRWVCEQEPPRGEATHRGGTRAPLAPIPGSRRGRAAD